MMRNLSSAVSLLSVFLLLLGEAQCSFRHVKLMEFQEKLQQKTSFINSSFAASRPAARMRDGRVFFPTGYGADPTGAKDSAPAILAALRDAAKVKTGVELLPGIKNLGGVVIDLKGGTFTISSPIRFPPGIGNVVVQGGTLRASNTFPGDRHLVELWSQPDVPGTHYEDITFRDVLFDSTKRGGGILAVNSVRTRIVNCFFLHFTTQGILIKGGHETFISDSFLGQQPTVGGDNAEKHYSGTAIDIASTDNVVTDVVIFSAAIGISLQSRANILTGVHCYNKATVFGGVGILVKSAQNRIVNCYLDYNSIVIEDPNQIHVSNGFFLGDGNIVLKSVQGRIMGLNIVDNMFSGDPKKRAPSVKLDGKFRNIEQVVIDRNVVDGMSLKSTVGKLTVAGNGTKWSADFGRMLLFPNKIDHVQYSIYAIGGVAAGFPVHAVTDVSNNVVVIESKGPVNGLVSVFVDQHNQAGEASL